MGERVTNSKHSCHFLGLVWFLGVAFGPLGGCAGKAQATPPQRSAAEVGGPSPLRVSVARTVVTPQGATNIPELFAQATAEGKAQHYEAAARIFQRAFELDPEGPLADKSLFEAAEMNDVGGQNEAALARYEQVARRFPSSDLDRVARVRALRLLTYLEQYERAGELAEQTTAKYKDLLSFDQLAVLAASALSRLARDDDAQADAFIGKARDIIERESLDAAGRVPAELAPIYFALGELRRIRAERIHFTPVPANFGASLEQRCQLLLDAQSAYSDAMRAYDAHWSAMAGFRVGELYQHLHEELMQVPAPKAADTERRRQLFEGAMRLRYSILLDKAKAMMEHTVMLGDRTNEQSPWILKARQARDSISRATEAEHQALARLPYTRDQLQAALDTFAAGKVPR